MSSPKIRDNKTALRMANRFLSDMKRLGMNRAETIALLDLADAASGPNGAQVKMGVSIQDTLESLQ